MGKSKQKLQKTRTGSSGSNVSQKGNGTKKEMKSKSETVKQEEIKKKDNLSDVNKKPEPVQTETDLNAEPAESWDSTKPEDIDKRFDNHKAKISQIKKDDIQVVSTPSSTNDQVVLDAKNSRLTKQNYDDFNPNSKKKSEDEYENYLKILNSNDNIVYTKVKEINEDLFKMSKEYSLAHCVAEDLNMGSGIAVQFSAQFKRYGELSNQRQKQGGLAILDFPTRFIYYLVTKKYSNGKPTLLTLWNSLTKMQKHVQENNVKQVAIPRIGCGLDRLEWNHVKFMIEHIFKDTDVLFTVCNFQQEDGAAPRPLRKCRIFNVSYPIVDIEVGTMIIYFGFEDGHVDSSIQELDKKFRILGDYKRAPKMLGQVVRTDAFNGDYVLFGFIVKKTFKNDIDYVNVQKCAQEVNKINKKFGKDCYQYLGIEMFEDPPNEDMMFHKVLNILRSIVREVDVYVCYPKELIYLMPKERSSDF